ncbi:related to dis1-suppressing protein kinase dsk1 [Claviceps purpurea 20.1]|uniref:non-specific serine/threonine protein kinase n=1 Tax=Claviceps purpurea (strain 20.1) TaxID=1111077 RepID=M1VTY2_CLAP2|nr:related to dis1-suppressing protein kinase dsk1 [Claviceps purpurea 20.1]
METSTTLQDQCDIFFYNGDDVQFEDLTRYKRFGLHPITLGDVLPKPLTCVSDVNKEPRYRIMLKLGFGAFATVWMARDLVEKRYVAVKVGHGSERPLPDREGEVLSQIRETGPGKLGYERVIELLDVFIVEGPNGFHQCLVTEVVSPLSDQDTAHRCSYDVVRQIVEGFAFLHGEGIVHGDPHIGNFGIALPQLEQFEEDDIIDFFASEEVVAVVPRDPKFPMNSIPPYIVASSSIGFFLRKRKAFPAGSLNVKILDFGRAYRMSQAVPNLLGAAPWMIRPPEFVLEELCDDRIGSTWSEAADIWAVGSLHDRVEVWKRYETRAYRNSFRMLDDESLEFLNLIKRMIITNPDERTPTTVLLTDPFMVRPAQDNDRNPTDTYKLMSINTASVKSDTSMHDAPPFLHQATHRSIAEKHPDITIPDAPPLPNQPEQQYTGMASITMRKFLASPVHYSYQPTVQKFAPASKEYISQDGFPHAPRVFPQQNNVNSVLLKEESLLKGGFTQIPHRMHQPNPLQVHHAQRYDVGPSEKRFRRSTEALHQHAPTQNISGASGPLLNPSTPSNNGHDARPSPRRPSKQPKQPSHDDDRGRAPPSPPSPSPSSSGSDFDHSDRLRRPAFSPIRDKESKRPLNDAEKGYPDKQKYGGGRYDLLEPKLNFIYQLCAM